MSKSLWNESDYIILNLSQECVSYSTCIERTGMISPAILFSVQPFECTKRYLIMVLTYISLITLSNFYVLIGHSYIFFLNLVHIQDSYQFYWIVLFKLKSIIVFYSLDKKYLRPKLFLYIFIPICSFVFMFFNEYIYV